MSFDPNAVERLSYSVCNCALGTHLVGNLRPDGDCVDYSDYNRLLALWQAQNETLAADGNRLFEASYLAGMNYVGCDTPDALAREVVELRTINAQLEANIMAQNAEIERLRAAVAWEDKDARIAELSTQLEAETNRRINAEAALHAQIAYHAGKGHK